MSTLQFVLYCICLLAADLIFGYAGSQVAYYDDDDELKKVMIVHSIHYFLLLVIGFVFGFFVYRF